MRAAHRPTTVLMNGEQVKIGAGQFVFGRDSAAAAMRMKPSTVRDNFALLAKMGNIIITPDTRRSIITVVNWATYQGDDDDERQVNSGKRKRPGTQPVNDENPDNKTTGESRIETTGSEPQISEPRQQTDTYKNVRSKEKDTVKRGVAASGKELMSLEFVLRLTDDEFKLFVERTRGTIVKVNPRFVWDNATGGFVSDLRKLIYKTPDARKVNILSETYRINGEKMNWVSLVLLAIEYTVRSASRSKINSAYLYTASMLTKPALLVGSTFDGKLKQTTNKFFRALQ